MHDGLGMSPIQCHMHILVTVWTVDWLTDGEHAILEVSRHLPRYRLLNVILAYLNNSRKHRCTCTCLIQAKLGCSTFIVFRRWGERPNERVITVGIGWVLLASATSGFSGYMYMRKACVLFHCQGGSSSSIGKSICLVFRRSWVQSPAGSHFFFPGFLYSLRKLIIS